VAFAATASASSTPNVTLQCAGVPGWSCGIGLIGQRRPRNPSVRRASAICLAEVGIFALEKVAEAGQRPHLGPAVEGERPPADHRAVERLRAFHVAGVEAVEVQ
jgi:hypothetical protein